MLLLLLHLIRSTSDWTTDCHVRNKEEEKMTWTHLLVVHKYTLEIWIFSVIDSHLGIRLPWKLTHRQRVPLVIYYAIQKVIPTFYCFYSNQHTVRMVYDHDVISLAFFFHLNFSLFFEWEMKDSIWTPRFIRHTCTYSFIVFAPSVCICVAWSTRLFIHKLQSPTSFFFPTFYDFGQMTHA